MIKMTKISSFAAAAVLGTVLLTGCGGGSSSSIPSTITGTAIKDKIVGGTATLYEADGTALATATTDSNGRYSFSGYSSTNRFVVVTGGNMVNAAGVVTGPNTMEVSAPASVSVANPATSLLVQRDVNGGFANSNGNALRALLQNAGVSGASSLTLAELLALVAVDYTGATSANESLQNIGQAAMAIANLVSRGVSLSTLTAIATVSDLNTTAANAGVDFSSIFNDDNNISDLESRFATGVLASAPLPLNISGSATIGDEEVSLIGNTFGTITRDALTQEEQLSDFYNVSFNVNRDTLLDRNVTDASMMILVKQTNSVDENRSIALTIDNIEIRATRDTNLSDDTQDSTLAITVKNGATISAMANGLSNIAPVSATLTSGDIALDETNGTVAFNLQTLLDAFNSTTVNDYIDSLNNYARQTDAAYTVAVGVDGNFTTGLSTLNPLLLTNSGLTVNELNVSAYQGFFGNINIGDATATNIAPSLTIALENISHNMVTVGETTTINFSTSDSNMDSVTVTAESNATSIATVSVSGNTATVTGVSEGYATITLTPNDGTVNGTSQTVMVMVEAAQETPSVTLSNSDFEGKTLVLTLDDLNSTETYTISSGGTATLAGVDNTLNSDEPTYSETVTWAVSENTLVFTFTDETTSTVTFDAAAAASGSVDYVVVDGATTDTMNDISYILSDTPDTLDISSYTTITNDSHNAGVTTSNGTVAYTAATGVVAGVYVSGTTITVDGSAASKGIAFSKGTESGTIVTDSDASWTADLYILPNKGYDDAGVTFAVQWDDNTTSSITLSSGDLD